MLVRDIVQFNDIHLKVQMTLFNDADTTALIIQYCIENNKLRPFQITSYTPHYEDNRKNVKLVP